MAKSEQSNKYHVVGWRAAASRKELGGLKFAFSTAYQSTEIRVIKIAQSTFGGILVLEIAFDKSNDQNRIPDIASQLFAVVSESPCQQILLDLKRLPFITSDVIGQLIMLNKKCLANHRHLKLCGVSGEIKAALEVVRFDFLVDFYDNKPQAIAAFKLDTQKPAEIDVDYGSATEHLELAERGDLDAQFRYGKCLEAGHGVAQDFEAALKWYKKAADRGHVESQRALGDAYAYGIGIPQDFEAAFDWYKKAAERGHADAQYMVGLSLQYGLVGEVDMQRSIKWFNEAAEQGCQPAQDAIAEIKREHAD